MKHESPHQQFHKGEILKYQTIIQQYVAKINNAREGFTLKAHNKFFLIAADEYKTLQKSMGKSSNLLNEIQDEFEDNKEIDYSDLFDQRFSVIPDSQKNVLLQKLIHLKALERTFSYLEMEGRKYQGALTREAAATSRTTTNNNNNIDVKGETKTNIQWKGKNELEFVQLIYGLHEAKLLDNEEGEITTLVKQVAEVFNYQLGKNWQSSLSKSVNIRKIGYKPQIFEKADKGFEQYRVKQISKDKKN